MLKTRIKQIIRNRHNLRVLIKDRLYPHPLLKRNTKFKDIHKGQRCFILGSGPSIVKQDLKKLQGEIVITQNNFHVHEDISIINPRYHCVIRRNLPVTGSIGSVRWKRDYRLIVRCSFISIPERSWKKTISLETEQTTWRSGSIQ